MRDLAARLASGKTSIRDRFSPEPLERRAALRNDRNNRTGIRARSTDSSEKNAQSPPAYARHQPDATRRFEKQCTVPRSSDGPGSIYRRFLEGISRGPGNP